MRTVKLSIYRYNPELDKKPYYMDYEVNIQPGDKKLLSLLVKIKDTIDDSLSFRRSCREGVCGSDAMNINGKNGLACLLDISSLKTPIVIRPLPGQPIIRDLIVDMTQFFNQYNKVKPFLVNNSHSIQDNSTVEKREMLQSPENRKKLDGAIECILCACCSTACPSFWWNPDKFLGPAALLHAYRFIADSRDEITNQRLDELNDSYKLFKCYSIMNCTSVCPKHLNPTQAISAIKQKMLK